MRRRDFITLLSGAAVAWPLRARAQHRSVPVVGFLAPGANDPNRWGPAFPQGLKEAGYVEGQNIVIDYRGGPPGFALASELVTEFVRRQVTVILTSGVVPAIAAKRATSTIPIVFFNIFSDPEKLGLVASIGHPGGNVTGVGHGYAPQLAVKRLDLLSQLAPTVATIAYLAKTPALSFEEEKSALVAAAAALGRQLVILECRTDDELGHCFATMIERGAGAATISVFTLGLTDSKIVSLAAQFKIPTMYPRRGFALQGGLMSYNEDPAENIRIAANMVGQVLNGARPADLPVRRSSKFDFVINLKTAKELGLTVPPSLLVGADRVIE